MDNTTNSLNWFEIPATDINRAQKFYETIFEIEMEVHEMDDTVMAFFPWTPGSGKATGAVGQSPNHTPSMDGTMVYLNANPAMDPVLARVEAAGGQILLPKTDIGNHGFMAFIMDTEGNRVGVHSIE
ncbi:VOC family protein [bacterium SCSIO 12643]|nr:VOC family protein [bacterium SCSIO 12643]